MPSPGVWPMLFANWAGTAPVTPATAIVLLCRGAVCPLANSSNTVE